MESHRHGHSGSSPFECVICEEMFDSHQYFMHHIDKLHFAKGKWRCHFCKTVFGDRLDLLLHLNRSHGKSLRLDTRFASSKSAVISVIPKGTVKIKRNTLGTENRIFRLSQGLLTAKLRYECPLCQTNLGPNKDAFQTHIKLHSRKTKTVASIALKHLTT